MYVSHVLSKIDVELRSVAPLLKARSPTMNAKFVMCSMVLLLAASSHDGVADDATNPKTTIHPELIEVRNLTGLGWDRSMLESIHGDRHPKVVALDQRIRRTELFTREDSPHPVPTILGKVDREVESTADGSERAFDRIAGPKFQYRLIVLGRSAEVFRPSNRSSQRHYFT